MAKYGMSMCTLGHAAEFRPHGIAVNSLWPRTAIATAALQMIPGVDISRCRKPEILADAAYLVLTSDATLGDGQLLHRRRRCSPNAASATWSDTASRRERRNSCRTSSSIDARSGKSNRNGSDRQLLLRHSG